MSCREQLELLFFPRHWFSLYHWNEICDSQKSKFKLALISPLVNNPGLPKSEFSNFWPNLAKRNAQHHWLVIGLQYNNLEGKLLNILEKGVVAIQPMLAHNNRP